MIKHTSNPEQSHPPYPEHSAPQNYTATRLTRICTIPFSLFTRPSPASVEEEDQHTITTETSLMRHTLPHCLVQQLTMANCEIIINMTTSLFRVYHVQFKELPLPSQPKHKFVRQLKVLVKLGLYVTDFSKLQFSKSLTYMF